MGVHLYLLSFGVCMSRDGSKLTNNSRCDLHLTLLVINGYPFFTRSVAQFYQQKRSTWENTKHKVVPLKHLNHLVALICFFGNL